MQTRTLSEKTTLAAIYRQEMVRVGLLNLSEVYLSFRSWPK